MDDHGFEEPIRILLVEDNPGDVRLVREAFDQVSAETSIRAVTDGADALESLRDRRSADAGLPDLVLLDLNLPRVDGFSVLEEIETDPELARIPCIILTGSNAREDIRKSYELAANTYLTKPSDPDEFVSLASSIEQFWFRHAVLPPA